MAKLEEIVVFLDSYLDRESVHDYPGAVNGLQVENSGMITRVVAAVDASLAVIEEAASVSGTLLVVHHGMFWQGVQTITGPVRRKIKAALDGDLALYSSHLPLDAHWECGNNILLAKALGLREIEPLPLDKKSGASLGLIGSWHGKRPDFLKTVAVAVGTPVHHCPGGPEQIARVAVMTGGAGSEVAAMSAVGADTFVTGEGPHWSYGLAEELGMNLIYAGHYATETFGVRALAARIAAEFGLASGFIDRPSGL
ncbi:MAG: Nif3-like dinuclear metal center hexameric protein [Luteolibacter sp.]|jgi:dinuclear metal center YbgI/SA1388 family protein